MIKGYDFDNVQDNFECIDEHWQYNVIKSIYSLPNLNRENVRSTENLVLQNQNPLFIEHTI